MDLLDGLLSGQFYSQSATVKLDAFIVGVRQLQWRPCKPSPPFPPSRPSLPLFFVYPLTFPSLSTLPSPPPLKVGPSFLLLRVWGALKFHSGSR